MNEIIPSVLDRLINLQPESAAKGPLSRSSSLAMLRSAVRRDLEWLLNSRSIGDLSDEWTELNRSVYTYGLPDLSELSPANPGDQNKLTGLILATINRFEPRLANVSVDLVEDLDPTRKEVRLRVEALLRIDPVPELVRFDTVIELKSGSCRVSGSGDER